MSRVADRFDRLRRARRKALIPYLTAGAPEPAWTVPLMHAAAARGADLIELGMPFSDPMADGPVIQKACERALANGVALDQVLTMVRHFRREDADTPVVLMGYVNPVEQMGAAVFTAAARDAGVDGLLLVDLPPEESAPYAASGLDMIRLVAPTTPAERVAAIVAAASGFVYYVSLKGVTGAQNLDPGALAQRLQLLGELTDLPRAVGFGISNPADAAAAARHADGVVVGSALMSRLLEARSLDDAQRTVRRFLEPMRAVLDNGGYNEKNA